MNSNPLPAGIRHLRDRMAAQGRNGESDEQLLHAFTTRRDEDAFAVLVRRHGPMVLHVCRRVLEQQQDAEDAFQAVFLLLAKSAAGLRNKSSLAGFLHGAAYRIALTAKRSAARRRKHEGSLGARTEPRSPLDPAEELSWREVRTLLDEEIARLPDKYRTVFVLCYLENLSQAEAARRLGLKERTLSSRLTEACKQLGRRLARRGVELTAVLSAMALAQQSASALPAGLTATTIKAALATATGEGFAGIVSSSVVELVQSATASVILGKAKMATALLLTATLLAGAGAWTCRILAMPQPIETSAGPGVPEQNVGTRSKVPQEKSDSMTVTGRVLDPDGKPAASARVFVDPQTPDEKLLDSATTGKDGRFSFTFPRSRLVDPETKFPLTRVRILAMAKGYGFDWLDLALDDAGKEATLRLVKDDVPIRGRILNLEGKPLAGVKVRIFAIMAFPRGDMDRALDAHRKGNQIVESTEIHYLWYRHHMPDPSPMATTDDGGRFRLEGIGRERIVAMNVEGPGIHYSQMRAMTRRAEVVRSPYKGDTIYGATFDYVVKPSRLIRGTVREKGTGKPLAGLRIRGTGFTDYATAETTTDEQGRYELAGCAKGDRYILSALPIQGAPYFGSVIHLKDTPGLGPLTADLEMVRGIPCEGKVLDGETGQAVPGKISYSPLYPNANVPPDRGIGRINVDPVSSAAVRADGTFRCVVLPGRGCLAFRAKEPARYQQACVDPSTVNADGGKRFLNRGAHGLLDQEMYQAIRLINPAKDAKNVSEILRLEVARQILGTVLDPDGKPLTAVRVRGLERSEGWKTLASEKLTVLGVNPKRPRQVYFIHDSKRLIAGVEVKGTETKPLTVRMQPWAAVSGRLLDGDGQPLCNMKLYGSAFLQENGCTDGEGRFRLDGLIPGVRYDLTYHKDKPSMSGTLLKGFVAKPGEVRDLGDIRTKPQQ
jgi:RNA polymerase sigma factor (sigma-70 family)